MAMTALKLLVDWEGLLRLSPLELINISGWLAGWMSGEMEMFESEVIWYCNATKYTLPVSICLYIGSCIFGDTLPLLCQLESFCSVPEFYLPLSSPSYII